MRKLISFLFLITLILLILNIFIKDKIINKYSSEYIRNTITNSLINSLQDNFDNEYIGRIEESLKNSSDFQVICDKFYNQIIIDLDNNTISTINIKEDILNIVETNYKDLNPGYKKYINDTINNMDFDRLYRNILGYIREKIPSNNIKYIDMLYKFLSIKTRLILILSLIIENVLLVLLTKDKKDLIITYGLDLIMSGGILIFIGLIISNIFAQINSFILAVGIVFLGIGMVLKEIYERKVL